MGTVHLTTSKTLFASLLFFLATSASAQDKKRLQFDAPITFHRMAVVGPDSRQLGESRPDSAKSKRYSAIGLITCDKENFKPTDPYLSAGTGTLVENNRTVVTAAHTFLKGDGSYIVDIRKNCLFNIINTNGEIIRSVKIEDVITVNNPNSKNIGAPETFQDGGAKNIQNDWAVVKLAEELVGVEPFIIDKKFTPNIRSKFEMCSFNFDIVDPNVKRCMLGEYKNNGQDSMFFNNPNVILYDIDTSKSSSGAPLFIESSPAPKVFGLNIGGKCARGKAEYNMESCRNYGLLFDSNFYKALDAVVRETGGSIFPESKSRPANYIRPVEPPKSKGNGVST